MRRPLSTVILGVLLVGAGVLLLLRNFNYLDITWELVWAVLFALGGLVFLVLFLRHPTSWWAIIPALTLLALGALIALARILPAWKVDWGGVLFLGAVGLSFWLVYLTNRTNWWAVIPGGVLFTLALVAGVEQFMPGGDAGGIFFLGLGITFALVYFLPTPAGRMRWAVYPAVALSLLGAIVVAASTEAFRFIWPGALILGGLYLVYRTATAPARHANGAAPEKAEDKGANDGLS